MLCPESLELSPGLVRLIDRAWRSEVCIELVVALGEDPMRALAQRYRYAVFLLVRSGPVWMALRESYEKHRGAGHSLLEIEMHELDEEGAVLERIERILAGIEAPQAVAEPAPEPRRGRRLICTDAITLADELRRS